MAKIKFTKEMFRQCILENKMPSELAQSPTQAGIEKVVQMALAMKQKIGRLQ